MSEISTSGGHEKSSMCSPGSHVAKQQLALPPYWGPQWGLQWRHPRCPVQSCRGWGSAQCLWRGWDANSRHDKDFKLFIGEMIPSEECNNMIRFMFHTGRVLFVFHTYHFTLESVLQMFFAFQIPKMKMFIVFFKIIIYSTKQYKTSKHLVIHHASTDDP